MNLADSIIELSRAGNGDTSAFLRMIKTASLFEKELTEGQLRFAGALAKTAFEISDTSDHPCYAMYCRIAARPEKSATDRMFASVVYESLGRVCLQQEKAANPLARGIAKLRGFAGAVVPASDLLTRSVLLTGGATGAASAAGLWGLNRIFNGENQRLRKLETERDTYHRLAAEVSAELKRRKLTPTPENTAAVVDYLT